MIHVFFFNDTATTEIYTLSLHDALPISEDVEREVNRRLELFPKGGLFLGPTHAIQVGSPLENILAFYRCAGSLIEKIDQSILDIVEDKESVDKIDMSKLF